jgi:hypothetical protein
MTRYWFSNCPACHQGRLFVEVRVEAHSLMLECEECSRAWSSPEQLSPTDNAFLAIEIQSRFADADEITRMGWSNWQFHQLVD